MRLETKRRWSCETPTGAELAALGIIGNRDVFGNRVVVTAQ